jgi:hypothetical protein
LLLRNTTKDGDEVDGNRTNLVEIDDLFKENIAK